MTTYERIEKVIRYLHARHREQPRLETLAAVAGLSVFHFQRTFSRWAGTTPKDFLKFLTNEHVKSLLRGSQDVLGAALEAGLSGPGRLHDLLVTVEGATPGQFKALGAGLDIRYGFASSPFGTCLLAVAPRGICHLAFIDGAAARPKALRELRRRWPKARLIPDPSATSKTAAHIFRRAPRARPPLVLSGTPFQIKVWEALLRIPSGKAVSYASLAAAIGRPRASRAVGSAVGKNSVAFLIPCHRVIRDTGVLGGYRWGLARKRAILAWESVR